MNLWRQRGDVHENRDRAVQTGPFPGRGDSTTVPEDSTAWCRRPERGRRIGGSLRNTSNPQRADGHKPYERCLRHEQVSHDGALWRPPLTCGGRLDAAWWSTVNVRSDATAFKELLARIAPITSESTQVFAPIWYITWLQNLLHRKINIDYNL
jgi:hypothetical protein